jgi:hypothetical protein
VSAQAGYNLQISVNGIDIGKETNSFWRRANRAKRRMSEYAARYNHGRAKKVSFKRPSPRLSKETLNNVAYAAFEE